jgi:YbbR domain-containing protein
VNRLIDNLFEKKMVVRIISILTALLMWFIVLDNENPIEVKIFTIPLTSNVEVLEAQNLRIIGAQPPTTVEVTVKGRRNKISNITSADFLAVT